MKRLSVILFVTLAIVSLGACSVKQSPPNIVPGIEIKRPANGLGIIGEVEPVYFEPISSPFAARIDTGAETSSIDVSNLKTFERDGEKWVSFTMTNRDTGQKHRFEKQVVRKTSVRRIENSEKRHVVRMDMKIGNLTINEEFSLANRDKFEYQILIGRNILSGRAIVNPAISNTLH